MKCNIKLTLVIITLFALQICRAQWERVADLPGDPGSWGSSFTIGSKAYVTLAYCPNYLWEYDTETDTWVQKASFPGECRTSGVAFSINGKGYFGTGWQDTYVNNNDWWEYDPANDTWTEKAPFPGGERFGAVAFSIGNKGYLGTGITQTLSASQVYHNDFWEYDPATDAWSQKADVPGSARKYAAGIGLNGYGYVGLGLSSSPPYDLSDFYEYNPVSDSWSQKQSVGNGRSSAGIFHLHGNIYIAGGSISSSTMGLASCMKFNPVSNQWGYTSNFGGGIVILPIALSFSNAAYMGMGFKGAVDNPILVPRKDWWKFTPVATSVMEYSTGVTVEVYPNPGSDYLHIEMVEGHDKEIKLWNSGGQLILRKSLTSSHNTLPISDLPKGVYVLEIRSAETVFRKKLILN